MEIGTEELPAAYLDAAIAQLKDDAARLFSEAHLTFAAVESFGTPRRLTLIINGLNSLQHNPPEEIRGPSQHASFDAAGKPTGALLGFLKARGGELSQTKIVAGEKGDYVYLIKPARQIPTLSVLPALISSLITRLRFPKTMRWDDTGARFARPVRWLIALYGTKTVPVAFGHVRSGNTTQINGPKRPKVVAVTSVASYSTVMKKAGVILDQRQRKQRIDQLVKTAAKQQRGVPAPETVSYGLLDEVTNLVEQPVVMIGGFDPKYLALSREVLLASMAKHQRVFAIQSGSKLLPKFVAILEGKPNKIDQIRTMFEHILNARLADSLLFLEQDRKRLPLTRLAERLKDVTFHEKLGSMADKTKRVEALVAPLADAWDLSSEQRQHLQRAALLAKADLVSTMVKEFPTLQGVVGKYYARDSHEPAEVADAIEEQYLPIGERMPKTLIGGALSVIEKFDTLTSYFGLGIEPTGDQDPFGLRRCAQGIVEISWQQRRSLPIAAWFEARSGLPPFDKMPDADKRRVVGRVTHYLYDRLYTFAWPKPAPFNDLISAVLSAKPDDVIDAMNRIRSLRQMDGGQALVKAAKVVERTTNILKGASLKQDRVDPERLQEPLERELWQRYGEHENRISDLIRERAYAEATSAYGEAFFDLLQEFFGHVMVNVKDEAIQQNRLALMRAINVLYTERVADLSKLVNLRESANATSPAS